MKNKSYPLYKIEPVGNLKDLVNFAAEKYARKPAFTFVRNKEVHSVSYYKFKLDVDALSTGFLDIKIENAKIAVIGENSYEWILTYFAAVNSGNVIVPLDKDLPAADIHYLLEDSGAEALVYSDDYADVAEYLQENGVAIKHYISMKRLSELLECGDVLIRYGDKRVADYKIDAHAMAALLYTSGTTGAAKGVMLSQHAIANDTMAACQNVKVDGNNLFVLPLHHAFGFVVVCAMLLWGSETYINSSLKKILTDMEKFKPRHMFLVPLFVETFYKKIWDGAVKQGKADLLKKMVKISNVLMKIKVDARRLLFKSVLRSFGGDLKLVVSGGAPLDPKYVQGFRDFGINVLNGYGITECAPIVSVNRNNYYRDGSIGSVLSRCEVKILEPDENSHGEICVKGDIVMLGYYNNEQATKEAFDGDWFKTGDIGYLDEDGFLFISGRRKNLIILGNGENVYPEELEFALLNHIPYIKEVIVYADDTAIIAEVFLDTENEPDCASRLNGDIVSFNQTQAPYKNIGRTVIREIEFPKTTTKKIKRQYQQVAYDAKN